jgi:hypothetical protein
MTPNPKMLDDLPANALHYAEFCMRGTGIFRPLCCWLVVFLMMTGDSCSA